MILWAIKVVPVARSLSYQDLKGVPLLHDESYVVIQSHNLEGSMINLVEFY